MITIEHHEGYLICRASGTLTKSDYTVARPEFETALKLRQGDLRMLIVLEDFSGWTPLALWEDLKFDFRHRNDFARIAIVGETALEEWGTWASKPFFGAAIRFFWTKDRAKAEEWLTEGESGPAAKASTSGNAA